MSRFTYDCKYCEEELQGSFGDNVYCKVCDITYETDWDYINEDSMGAWITEEHKGKVDIEE